MQQTYQELRPDQDFSHLARTVEQYFSSESPLWWVELISGESFITSPVPAPFQSKPEPIGCLWLGNAIEQVSGDRQTHILLLYVRPNHRRQGIGTALMEWAETWAKQRGDREISLQVFQKNKPALSLYGKLGYQPHSLWMTKLLSS
jgi:GNAT superfamily N-acetyltransferase